MEAPHVAIRGAALQIDGRRTLLYGGELQYFRVRDRHGNAARTFDMWAERLDALAEAGLNAISTYIPWDEHAPAPGRYDWDGVRDVRRFAALVAERGMHLIIKPGPHILAEWPYGFGSWGAIPTWWVLGHPRELVLERSGRPFQWHLAHPRLGRRRERLPSYASERFIEAVRGWFAAVLEQLGDLIGPGRPIVAIQLDNETNFFWSSCYRIDFHPRALAIYREQLRRRYGHIAALRRRYRKWFRSFDDVLPPRRPDIGCAPWHRDWLLHQRLLVDRYLARIRALWTALGVREPDVLFLTNDTPKTFASIRTLVLPDGRRKSVHGVLCLDTYPRGLPLPQRALFDAPYEPEVFARLYARWSAVHPLVAADPKAGGDPEAGRLSMGIEIQGGHFGIPLPIPGWRPVIYPHRVRPEATRQTLLRLLALGMRAIVVYTVAAGWNRDGSDYGFQAALGPRGERTARYEELARVGRWIARERAALLRSHTVCSPVGILVSSSQLDTARGKGVGGGQRIFGEALRGLWGWCVAAGLQPDVSDLALADDEELARMRVWIWPSTGEPIPEAERERLLRFVARGGLLVQLFSRAPLREQIGGRAGPGQVVAQGTKGANVGHGAGR